MVKIQGVKADQHGTMLLAFQAVGLTCCMLGWGEERAICISYVYWYGSILVAEVHPGIWIL